MWHTPCSVQHVSQSHSMTRCLPQALLLPQVRKEVPVVFEDSELLNTATQCKQCNGDNTSIQNKKQIQIVHLMNYATSCKQCNGVQQVNTETNFPNGATTEQRHSTQNNAPLAEKLNTNNKLQIQTANYYWTRAPNASNATVTTRQYRTKQQIQIVHLLMNYATPRKQCNGVQQVNTETNFPSGAANEQRHSMQSNAPMAEKLNTNNKLQIQTANYYWTLPPNASNATVTTRQYRTKQQIQIVHLMNYATSCKQCNGVQQVNPETNFPNGATNEQRHSTHNNAPLAEKLNTNNRLQIQTANYYWTRAPNASNATVTTRQYRTKQQIQIVHLMNYATSCKQCNGVQQVNTETNFPNGATNEQRHSKQNNAQIAEKMNTNNKLQIQTAKYYWTRAPNASNATVTTRQYRTKQIQIVHLMNYATSCKQCNGVQQVNTETNFPNGATNEQRHSTQNNAPIAEKLNTNNKLQIQTADYYWTLRNERYLGSIGRGKDGHCLWEAQHVKQPHFRWPFTLTGVQPTPCFYPLLII